jgi:recombination protein RecT
MATASKGNDLQVAGPAMRVKQALERKAADLAAVLPRHMTPEKQIQVVTTLVYRTPKLQECDPLSIVAAVMEASELGLSLSRSSGEAYLVPYWNKGAGCNEAQFQPGYRGLVKLAYQSGAIAYAQARLVRPGDEFSVVYDPDLVFRHAPRFPAEGEPDQVYAIVKLANGERMVEVMTLGEVERVRARSKSKDSGPWVTDYDEMAKKTPLKRLMKVVPRSVELDRALEADDRQYEDGPRSVVTAPPGRGTAGLRRALGVEPAAEPEFTEGTSGQVVVEDEAPGQEPGEEG